jgi:hypothetical protein
MRVGKNRVCATRGNDISLTQNARAKPQIFLVRPVDMTVVVCASSSTVRALCILLTTVFLDDCTRFGKWGTLLIFSLPFCADALLPKTAES